MKAKHHKNLYRKKGQPNWVFSKYSAAKRGEFRVSTGILATEANAASAHREGYRRYTEWLGHTAIRAGRSPLIRDIGKILLDSKKAKARATEIKARCELNNYIYPAFGHLRPGQVTSLMLQKYENSEREIGRKSLFNTRKYLFQILRLAKDEGLIKSLPTWKLSDPAPDAPKFIDAATARKIRRLAEGDEKFVQFILYYQGARPREVIQYRWEMINLAEGTITVPASITKTRRARTIPLNSRVVRALRWRAKTSGPIFPMRGTPGKSRVVYDRYWLDAVEKLGLDFTVYNLRDSFITRKVAEGASSVYVARYVDSSVKEIEKRYAVPLTGIMRGIAG